MKAKPDVKFFNEFDEYYIATNGLIRSKNPNFHIFKLGELGNNVVSKMAQFKINYFHISLGSSLNATLSVFDTQIISEDFTLVIFIPGQIIEWEKTAEWDGYVIDVKEMFLNLTGINELEDSFKFLFESKPLVIKLTKDEFSGLSYLYELMYTEHSLGSEENIFIIKKLLPVLLIYINRIIQKSKSNTILDKPKNYFAQLTYFENTSRFKSLVLKEYMVSKSVQYYAEKLNVTPALLNKSIRQTINRTAKDVINEALLLHSKTMLKKTDVAIKEIASQLNFDDYSHYVKFFKAMTGFTPADYRMQAE